MRIVYLGVTHAYTDGRLLHREMATLKRKNPEAELFYVGYASLPHCAANEEERPSDIVNVVDFDGWYPEIARRAWSPFRLLWRFYWWFWRVRKVISLNPDLVQASDVKELPEAFFIGLFSGCRLIYDAHEDYFNQYYEYRGRTLFALLIACYFSFIEILFVRFFECVFCTDEFLQKLYQRSRYGAKKVVLLRNFPPPQLFTKVAKHSNKDHLRLVYSGLVNAYRGVLSCCDYVLQFNEKHSPEKKLSLHLFARPTPLLDKYKDKEAIVYYGWITYPELASRLTDFDVGVALLKRIKKLERNIPTKNFDFMAAGLPLIASNFGNGYEYVKKAQAGICIEPESYAEFEEAVLTLFSLEERERFARNGRTFVEEEASVDKEYEPYVQIMLGKN